MVLFSRVRAPKWSANEDPWEEAKCRKLERPRYGADPFFDNEEKAMAVCNGWDAGEPYENNGEPCPLRAQCLVFSLINHEGAGTWGGMLLHDRMHLKRNIPKEQWTWHPPTPKPEKSPSPDEISDQLAA